MEVRRHLRDEDIVAVLDELTAIRGAPAHIQADNGPEMSSKAVRAWCKETGYMSALDRSRITLAVRNHRELRRPPA
jgi:hypothetical protein